MADDKDTTPWIWVGIAVGLSLAAFTVMLVMFSRRRDGELLSGAGAPQIGGAPVIQQFFGAPNGVQSAAVAALPAPRDSVGSSTTTYRLPSLTDATSEAIRIAGSRRPMRITVRPVDPPGAFASFSYSSTELNLGPALAVGGVPSGGGIGTVPVGSEDTYHLKANDVLYAKGSDPNVLVSVTATPV